MIMDTVFSLPQEQASRRVNAWVHVLESGRRRNDERLWVNAWLHALDSCLRRSDRGCGRNAWVHAPRFHEGRLWISATAGMTYFCHACAGRLFVCHTPAGGVRSVIPAQAGIHPVALASQSFGWTPASAGVTGAVRECLGTRPSYSRGQALDSTSAGVTRAVRECGGTRTGFLRKCTESELAETRCR
jgi:hypothetical protein